MKSEGRCYVNVVKFIGRDYVHVAKFKGGLCQSIQKQVGGFCAGGYCPYPSLRRRESTLFVIFFLFG